MYFWSTSKSQHHKRPCSKYSTLLLSSLNLSPICWWEEPSSCCMPLLPWQSCIYFQYFFFYGATAPSETDPPLYRGLTITPRQATLGRTPLDEWSARRRDLYLSIHNNHKKHTSMPSAGFPASQRPHIHALDRQTTMILATIYTSNFNVLYLVHNNYDDRKYKHHEIVLRNITFN